MVFKPLLSTLETNMDGTPRKPDVIFEWFFNYWMIHTTPPHNPTGHTPTHNHTQNPNPTSLNLQGKASLPLARLARPTTTPKTRNHPLSTYRDRLARIAHLARLGLPSPTSCNPTPPGNHKSSLKWRHSPRISSNTCKQPDIWKGGKLLWNTGRYTTDLKLLLNPFSSKLNNAEAREVA